ncbi:hypothetical protein MP228_010667 [Amoeboaphelidium protococcarum]|nr:hypothetical protein MP228_010667 [Amoeboaphelidium protococcarum]
MFISCLSSNSVIVLNNADNGIAFLFVSASDDCGDHGQLSQSMQQWHRISHRIYIINVFVEDLQSLLWMIKAFQSSFTSERQQLVLHLTKPIAAMAEMMNILPLLNQRDTWKLVMVEYGQTIIFRNDAQAGNSIQHVCAVPSGKSLGSCVWRVRTRCGQSIAVMQSWSMTGDKFCQPLDLQYQLHPGGNKFDAIIVNSTKVSIDTHNTATEGASSNRTLVQTVVKNIKDNRRSVLLPILPNKAQLDLPSGIDYVFEMMDNIYFGLKSSNLLHSQQLGNTSGTGIKSLGGVKYPDGLSRRGVKMYLCCNYAPTLLKIFEAFCIEWASQTTPDLSALSPAQQIQVDTNTLINSQSIQRLNKFTQWIRDGDLVLAETALNPQLIQELGANHQSSAVFVCYQFNRKLAEYQSPAVDETLIFSKSLLCLKRRLHIILTDKVLPAIPSELVTFDADTVSLSRSHDSATQGKSVSAPIDKKRKLNPNASEVPPNKRSLLLGSSDTASSMQSSSDSDWVTCSMIPFQCGTSTQEVYTLLKAIRPENILLVGDNVDLVQSDHCKMSALNAMATYGSAAVHDLPHLPKLVQIDFSQSSSNDDDAVGFILHGDKQQNAPLQALYKKLVSLPSENLAIKCKGTLLELKQTSSSPGATRSIAGQDLESKYEVSLSSIQNK